MKKLQILMMCMIFGFSTSMHADVKTNASGTCTIINSSTAPIKFNMTARKDGHNSDQVFPTALIAPGATGTLAYDNKLNIKQAWVVYYQSDGKTLLDTKNIVFSPTKVPTTIYVYGNNTVPVSNLDTSNSATPTSSPMPSRCVAWWSGNIDVSKDASAAAAIADTANVGPLVTLYMLSLDGRSLLTF